MLIDIIIANIDAMINYIPLFALSVFSLNLRLTKKLTLFLLVIYCFVIITASVVLTYIDYNNFFSNNLLFILIVPLLIFFLIVVEDNISKGIFVFFAIFTYTMFIDVNSTMLALKINISNNPLVLNIIIKVTLHTVLFYPLLKYVTVPFNMVLKNVDKRYWYPLSLLPIVVCFVTLKLSQQDLISMGNTGFLMINAICIFSFCVFFIIYYLFKKTLNIIQLENNMVLAKNQLSLQREHYKQLSDSILNLKRLQHDTKYHFTTLRELAKNDNLEGIKAYLNDILKKQPDYNYKMVCEHFAADAILRHYIMVAKANNIKLSINVNIPENINIDSYDMSVILGNCLENAIEASEKVLAESDRKIDISANIKNSYFIIKIVNTFDGNLNYRDGVFHTQKKSTGHGLGLQNVKTVVDKYKGNVRVESGANTFMIVIALFIDNTVI